MKKAGMLVSLLVMIALLCSCSGLGGNIADSIFPPKPSGELYEIQQALETFVGGRIKLSYPSSGKYRSAIITEDLDGDDKYEVFSFYSTETDDKTTVMHINYIKWTENGWASVSDLEVNGSGVESVDFATLDYSGVPKIVVSWSRYSAVNKQISVYDINSGELVEVTSAVYSVSAVTDFNSDGINEIVAVHLDAENLTSTAKMLSLTEEGLEQKGECMLDGTVTAYREPIFSKLADGTPALFLDADKSTGMITEVMYLKKGEFVNAFSSVDHLTGENNKTLRASSVRSKDYDGDGSVDIPLASKLPAAEGTLESDSVYLTSWNSFDGHVFKPIAHTVINYTDGYYLEVPDKWLGSFTIIRKLDIRQRVVVRWNADTVTLGEEVLWIQTVNIRDFDPKNFEKYIELARTSESIYLVRLGNSALNPGEQVIKENFHLIDE